MKLFKCLNVNVVNEIKKKNKTKQIPIFINFYKRAHRKKRISGSFGRKILSPP